MIDPAILRPGRLDVKIKIERPDAGAARDIFSKYLLASLPLAEDVVASAGGDREAALARIIDEGVKRMYSDADENRFLEVTYANGDKEVLYFKDFNSGAMIENIVSRAKKMAIKRFLETGEKGIKAADLFAAVTDEFKENEDLPNTTNPDDWARISGKKGERIVYVRTLIEGGNSKDLRAHHRAGQRRAVPVGFGLAERSGEREIADGHHQGHGHRDRVWHHRARRPGLQPGAGLQPPGQRLLGPRPQGPLGLRGGVAAARRPRVRGRPRARDPGRGRPRPGQRHPHQRRPLLRRPRPPRVLLARVPRPAHPGRLRQGRGADPGRVGPPGGRAGPGRAAHPGLQEQHRRQGHLLRHPRELPGRPGDPVRPDRPRPDPVPGQPPGVRRRRAAWSATTTTARSPSRSPSAPSSSRSRSAWRRPSSGRSSTPATSPTPTPSATGACT